MNMKIHIQNISGSLHNSVDINIGYYLQILKNVTKTLDFSHNLMYSNEALKGYAILCDRVMSAVCNLHLFLLLFGGASFLAAFANPRFFHFPPVFRIFVLFVIWCAGLMIGYSVYEPSFSYLMHSSAEASMSIIGVFVCIYLPFISTYFSVITDKPVLILFICFCKAAALGFSSMLIFDCFASAAWMIRLLFLFSDILVSIVLMLVWIRYFLQNHPKLRDNLYLFVILLTAVSLTDQFVIYPLLMGLL